MIIRKLPLGPCHAQLAALGGIAYKVFRGLLWRLLLAAHMTNTPVHPLIKLDLLQAHTWPGLRMKPQSGAVSIAGGTRQDTEDGAAALHAPQPRFHTSAAAALEHSSLRSPASAQPPSDGEQMGAWQGAASPEVSSTADPVVHHQQHSADGSMEGPHLNGVARAPDFDNALEESGSEASGSEEDGGLEEFESMMRQLRQGRDHLQGLPDEERRARAASMAAHMMQALGIHDEDSDSEGVT
ncbi:g10608 [Coccomyxa viridis]|uniref:G10608 protein n=1 Tax=Coccomyxa viridis TaxID=1274662 RepID=A0ABP1GA06_9CHLO